MESTVTGECYLFLKDVSMFWFVTFLHLRTEAPQVSFRSRASAGTV